MPYQGKQPKEPMERTDPKTEGSTVKERLKQFLDDHIRTIAALGAILVVILLFVGVEAIIRSNALTENGSYTGKDLSMKALYALSEKTSPITWKDLGGISYTTMSEDESTSGTYVLRRYSVEGGTLSLLVGGYVTGKAHTGAVAYAELKHIDHFDFSFSLIEDEDLLGYLDKFMKK